MKIKLFIILSTLPFFLYSQNFIRINGTISEQMNGKNIKMSVLYPFASNSKSPKALNCIIKNGKFHFQMPANGVELYGFQTTINGKIYNKVISLFPKVTSLKFSDGYLKTYIIKENDANFLYSQALKESGADTDHIATVIPWIRKNINSPFCPQFLYTYNEKIPQDSIVSLYELIPDGNKKNSWGQDLSILIEKYIIGKQAPDFEQKDNNNNSVKLSDFKGKYVLLDFWASWCVPCRKENPFLSEVYKNYKNKGFEILSVSLDDSRSKWFEAINEDNMEWKHVSDLKGAKNEIAKLYNVYSIPSNFLINPAGIVIAKNLRGKALEVELKKIFKN